MKRIKLSQGKFALVDDEVLCDLLPYKWFAHFNPDTNSFYALRKETKNRVQKAIQMSRQIMDAPKGMVVDHKNHNTLDNRKSNLRICTQSQNLMNRGKTAANKSGFKGVRFNKSKKKWESSIKVMGKAFHLGTFSTPLEAYKEYCKACLKYHGAFANTGK
jgi:hypothetical protein